MNSNLISGHASIFTDYPPGKEKSTVPDPGLTIATIILCIGGPFWLIYRFARYLTGKIGAFSQQVDQRTKNLPEIRLVKVFPPYKSARAGLIRRGGDCYGRILDRPRSHHAEKIWNIK